jgi:TonB family protein
MTLPLAGSLTLHLLLGALILVPPLLWEAGQVRMPVREVLLVELNRLPPAQARAAAASQAAKAAPSEAAAPAGRKARLREETVSLETAGRYRGYLREIKRRIEEGWELTAAAGEGELLLLFSVERTGRVSQVRLLISSGDAGLDASALSAVRRVQPFPPMPDSMDVGRLNVRAGFCYRLASR